MERNKVKASMILAVLAALSVLGASADKLYNYALTGVPVVPGAGKSYGGILPDDLRIDISSQTSRNLCELRREDGETLVTLP